MKFRFKKKWNTTPCDVMSLIFNYGSLKKSPVCPVEKGNSSERHGLFLHCSPCIGFHSCSSKWMNANQLFTEKLKVRGRNPNRPFRPLRQTLVSHSGIRRLAGREGWEGRAALGPNCPWSWWLFMCWRWAAKISLLTYLRLKNIPDSYCWNITMLLYIKACQCVGP